MQTARCRHKLTGSPLLDMGSLATAPGQTGSRRLTGMMLPGKGRSEEPPAKSMIGIPGNRKLKSPWASGAVTAVCAAWQLHTAALVQPQRRKGYLRRKHPGLEKHTKRYRERHRVRIQRLYGTLCDQVRGRYRNRCDVALPALRSIGREDQPGNPLALILFRRLSAVGSRLTLTGFPADSRGSIIALSPPHLIRRARPRKYLTAYQTCRLSCQLGGIAMPPFRLLRSRERS